MDESSARRVTAILEERGLQVSEVERVGKRAGFARLGRPLRLEDLELFNDHLLAVAKSGLPMAPALKGIAKDFHKKRLRRIVQSIQADLEKGSSLDEALSKHPDSFPPIYATAIRAGERAGNLSGVLSVLNTHSSRMIDIRNTVQAAFAYPILVLICAAGVMSFLLVKVIPVFDEIFQDFGVGLPAPTQFWVDISRVMNANLVPISVMAILVFAGWPAFARLARRTYRGGYIVDWLKHYIPVVGKTFIEGSLARFSRSLGILLAGGVPIVESLDLASAASGNAVLREKVRLATLDVAGGQRVADALSDTGYFSHTFCWLFSIGEERGELDEALMTIAGTYEREIARRDRLFGFLIGPVLVIFLALAVGSMVVALYLPIFTLGDAIGM